MYIWTADIPVRFWLRALAQEMCFPAVIGLFSRHVYGGVAQHVVWSAVDTR